MRALAHLKGSRPHVGYHCSEQKKSVGRHAQHFQRPGGILLPQRQRCIQSAQYHLRTRKTFDSSPSNDIRAVGTQELALRQHLLNGFQIGARQYATPVLQINFDIISQRLHIKNTAHLNAHVGVFLLHHDAATAAPLLSGTRTDTAQCLLHRLLKAVVRKRFKQKVYGIKIEALKRILCMGRSKHQTTVGRQSIGNVEPADTVHLYVQKYQVGVLTAYGLKPHPRFAEGSQLHAPVTTAELLYHQQGHRLVVNGNTSDGSTMVVMGRHVSLMHKFT